MKLWKRFAAVMLSAALCMPIAAGIPANAEGKKREVTIDGSRAVIAETQLYRGAGMVSGNNSSRLLLDYKAENPEAYWEIMNHLFGKKGIGLCHIKIEMGSDVNSSSGTEPNIMRTADELPDVTRGAGYQLAADALTINPDITLDMLYWSEPRWVTDAEDVYDARYSWYKAHLDAAYDTYGMKFQYVSAVRNERPADVEWIKYLSKRLKSETDCKYDYSQIKIVAGDEVTTWGIAGKMLQDEELLNAIDVVGSHYTSWSSADAKKLSDKYGKELWFSEASSPMAYSKGTYRYDATGSGLNDINGLLDIANRYITMFPGGKMTMCEYQPVIAAYYDGVTYCHKQMITANTPWDGSYLLDGGYYMALHFSQFIDKGWSFVDGACYGDGVAGGDGHAIVDAEYSYVTATDTASDNYSVVITNTTAEPITYSFNVKNLDKAGAPVYIWETRCADEGSDWRSNYFRNIGTITPAENNGSYSYEVTIKPYSLVTLSTVERSQSDYEYNDKEFAVLNLPYSDDFEYADYPEDYLSSRSGAPRYTTDQGGAFEVVDKDGNNVLMQKITTGLKADEWGSTPNPTTNFGDDRWYDYAVAADVGFAASADPAENYTGIGLRYNLACNGNSGYWIQLYENGYWKVKRNGRIIAEGSIENFDSTVIHRLKIQAVGNNVKAFADGVQLCDCNGSDMEFTPLSAGRAALFSYFENNWFDNVEVTPIEHTRTIISRCDNTDAEFSYSGIWEHKTMDSYKNYKRTISNASEGAELTCTFTGTDIDVTGVAKECNLLIEVDGVQYGDNLFVKSVKNREVIFSVKDLTNEQHTVKVTVLNGSFSVDGAQISGIAQPVIQQPLHTVDEQPEETAAPTDDSTESSSDIPNDNSAVSDSTASDGNNANGGNILLPIGIGAGVVAIAAAIFAIIRKRKK